jgi:hypothetical protein
MTTKEAILEMIQNLPDSVTVEEVIAALYYRWKVDKGLRELDEGKGIPHAEVRDRLRKRLK